MHEVTCGAYKLQNKTNRCKVKKVALSYCKRNILRHFYVLYAQDGSTALTLNQAFD